MTIGTVARAAGVGVETVRFYERKGLIKQPDGPTSGGFRNYPEQIVWDIKFIRQARDVGFSLREIAELLALRQSQGDACDGVLDLARRKRDEVAEKINQLTRTHEALADLVEACPGAGPARECPILGALDSAARRPSA